MDSCQRVVRSWPAYRGRSTVKVEPQQAIMLVQPETNQKDIYDFAADYPGAMVSLVGIMLIVIWFFIRKK